MTLPTETEIRAYQAKKHAEREAEFAANPPAGSSGFTYNTWSSLSFGDQAYYRRGESDPNYKPDTSALRELAGVIADTPSPSIVSGYGTWAFDILELLHRRGWKLVQK